MTEEEKTLRGIFTEIKEIASQKHKDVPKNRDIVDLHYFYSLSALFQLQRVGAFREEDVQRHSAQLENKYVADKALHLRDTKESEDMHQRRMKCSQLISKLTKGADKLTDGEIIELCFSVIDKGFDSVTAKVIREKYKKGRKDKMLKILSDESEFYINEFLISFGKMKGEDVQELIAAAKRNGMSAYGGYMIRQSKTAEGKFNLYRKFSCKGCD